MTEVLGDGGMEAGGRDPRGKRETVSAAVSALQNMQFLVRRLACRSAARVLQALALEQQLSKLFSTSASSQIHIPSGCSTIALVQNPLTEDLVHEQKMILHASD